MAQLVRRALAASRGPVSAPGLPEPVRPDPEPYLWSTDPADADPVDTARALTEHSPSGGPCEDRMPLGIREADLTARRSIGVDSSRHVTRLDEVD